MGCFQSRTNQYEKNLQMLQSLEQIIFNLNDVNIDESVESSIIYFNQEFPYSFNFIICSIVYSYYTVESSDIVCLEYLKKLELKEKELYNTSYDIFRDVFACFLNPIHTTESFYLFEKMITNEIIEPNLCESMTTSYFFLHHMSNYKNIKQNKYTKYFYDNFGLLSKNDWELHKKLIEEGHNPNEITRIIRNDEVEKLQEISSQTNFNFNQKIKPSLYERCSFINEDYVKLIDYAAFFSSIKCFKYLLINGANIDNTGNYAVASGNEEIIHLCEQNHSLYPSAYEAAIKFHRNDIFYYLYDNQIVKIDNIEWLGVNCILCNNYEILSFLEKKGMNIYESFIIKSIVTGNFFIFQYLHEKNPITINFLEISTVSKNKEFLNYLFNNTYINKKIAKFNIKAAFIHAFNKGYLEIVKFLLEQEGIDVNAKDMFPGSTTLIEASERGHTEIVKLLLEQKGIDINAKDKNYGRTALILASLNGHTEIVKLLLEQKGIDVNAKDKDRDTALILASDEGYTEIVKLFLEHEGIDINAKDNYKKTALMVSARNGHIEIVKLLLEQKGIDINAKDEDGKTALMGASGPVARPAITKLLLEQKGIFINAKDRDGNTALIYASQYGYTEIVKLLLEQKEINVNNRNIRGETALLLASFHGYTKVVKLLLEQKEINVNNRNIICVNDIGLQNNIWKLYKLFETALTYASSHGHTKIVKLLQNKQI